MLFEWKHEWKVSISEYAVILFQNTSKTTKNTNNLKIHGEHFFSIFPGFPWQNLLNRHTIGLVAYNIWPCCGSLTPDSLSKRWAQWNSMRLSICIWFIIRFLITSSARTGIPKTTTFSRVYLVCKSICLSKWLFKSVLSFSTSTVTSSCSACRLANEDVIV